MIRYFAFLLIVFFITGCGAVNKSQFSKRKHLKGHFWNVKEKYKKSNSVNTEDHYSFSSSEVISTDDQNTSIPLDTEKDKNNEKFEDPLVDKEEVAFDGPIEVVNEVLEETEVQITKPNFREPAEAQQIESIKSSSSKGVSSLLLGFLILLALSFWLGIAGLIVTLFLYIFSSVIPWLLYTSLILVGIPVFFGIIAVIVISIAF